MLLVGVNHYHDPQLPSLQYSAIDCQGVGEALVEATHAFPQKDIQIYHDAATLPHLDAVRASLKQIVAKAEPQDTVLFYFSGHGMLEPRKEQAFLCFADTQKGTLIDTGLSVVELLHLLGNCAARQQLIWLDACHSGGMTLMGTGARAAKDVEPLANPTPQLVDVLRQRASQSQGFYALLSCDRAQQSWEFPELGHGVFSYYLMRGLRGEAADAQGVIEADGLYKYVYHQTLQYIDKTNQQLRLINQQKRGRGDTQLHSEYPLQTPKRIVEGIGELVLGLQARSPIAPHPRTALVVNGLVSHPNAIGFSRLLRSAGGFDLTFRPQPGNDWSDLRTTIQTCLRSSPISARLNADTPHPTPHTPLAETTAFLYLRGRIEETAEGESWLLLGDDVRLSRSWLRQALRQAGVAQQVVVLDCPGAVSLSSWVDDLQLNAETPTGTGHDRGQCLLAAASSLSQPDRFLQILLQTLTDTDAQAGLPIAGWITRLQVALAGSGMPLHVWLSGARGVIEVLPGCVGSRGTDTTEGFDVGVCPYMGLRSFSEADVQYFYGRETLTQTLIQQLNQRSCLAVVGASGSGKSSVVQAGLLAQLQQGKQLPGSDRWWLGSLRPGAYPLKALAHRLVETGSEKEKAYQQQQLEGLLHQGAEGFVHWLRQRSEPMVVLVVDQFEELFTLAAASERQQFLALLFGAMEYASDRFKLVFTLRADFIAACLEVPELATILQRSSVLVPPTLTDDDYRQVIIQPAAQVGLQVEPELVEVLLAELSHSAGALPLLEFVLEQLWSRRQAGVLTLQTYQQLGGLKVALERNAQAVYDSLDADAQACAQWIFLALTQLGENTEDTRRRIPKTDLIVPKYPEPLVDRTLHALTTAKLIVISLHAPQPTAQSRGDTTDHSSTSHPTPHTPHPSPTIEVAHEILIRHWSTLRWWLDENRSRLRAQRHIAEAAALWQQHDRQPDFLLQGIRLAEAEELYIQYTDELPQAVQQFIEACFEARQQQQRQAKRRLRRAQMTATVIGTLGVMACGLAGVAYWQQRNAQLREVDALAASSEALLASNQQLESLTASVQAGSQLRQLRSLWGIPLGLPIATETRTTGALQQAIAHTQEVNRLEGHTNKVNAVSFSPDEQRLATAGDDKTIKLWRRDGTLIKELTGHSDRVTALAFSPDGKLATTSADKTIKLWDSDGNLIATLTGHKDWVTSVSFSPNGLLATASRDRTVKLWRITGNQASLLLTITGAKGWVNSVQFSPNGQWLAAAGEDGLIRIWRTVASNRPPVSVFLGGGDRITAIAFSPNGASLVSAGKTVKLWSLTGRLLQTFDGQSDPANSDQVNSVRFSPDGRQLATVSDRTIKLWSLDGTLLQTFQGHRAEVNSVAFSPDGTTLASASVDKTVRLWHVSPLQTYGSGPYSASFSPDGTRFATAGWGKTIQIWQRDGMTTKLVMTLKGHQAPIAAVSFSPDGQWLASGSADKMVKLWKLPDGILARSLTGHTDSITTLSFSPDSKTLATGSADKTIRLWNVPDGLLVRSLSGHTDGITAVRFSPDGQRLASGSNDNTVRLWSLAGTDSNVFGQHGLAISALSFNHDGKILASGSWDDTIKLWDVSNGTLLKTLLNHSDGVTSLDFSPDRDLLAVGGTDATLKLWDIQHETPLKTLTRHVDSLRSVHFSPTGQTLISTSETSGAIVWELDLDTLLKQGCSQLHDYLQTQPSIANIRKQC